MTIRRYRSEDCRRLTELFYDTVHSVNARDYAPEQLDAWATGQPDLEAWDRSLHAHESFVAEENGVIIGFGDIDQSGYLDRLFVDKDHQGRGVATALCDALESGHLGGVALDVTDPEPLPADHRLWNIPNAIITPHVSGGWSLPETFERIVRISAENLRRYFLGEPLRNVIDRNTRYRKL